ncbi:NAD(P)-dependent oxidoreductase [Pseudonocardia eucalypti]|uniref:NAD(P)-dependent oxidoreductase n=1 Tax=Pseudonocardia eucalypti TaxID=648755 RepID=A0ABP9PH96_9PSEU|nr:3-hydroxyisobutyrate dehydrogenase-like beta-hydroxyacid dehydrogenase [Pseudonocardia eucalypti]
MSEAISLIGLGAMGQALAAQLVKAGHRVTLWNRTRSRADALLEQGANWAGTPAEAMAASPVTVLCISNYPDSEALLADVPAGAVIVQITTGTPEDAVGLEKVVTGRGAAYLDGLIAAYPSMIGTGNASIYYSGPRELFDRHADVLRDLGATPVHLREEIGAANLLDAAVITMFYGILFGFSVGAGLATRAGLEVKDFASIGSAALRSFPAAMADVADKLATGDMTTTEATLDTYVNGLDTGRRTAEASGADTRFHQVMLDYLHRAREGGHGSDDIARLVQMFTEGTAA